MDDRPYGALRYLKLPNGVIKVNNWLSSSSGHWWYPLLHLSQWSTLPRLLKCLQLLLQELETGISLFWQNGLDGKGRHTCVFCLTLFGGYYNRGTPLCHLSNWCDDALFLQQVKLCFQFVSVSEWDCSWCLDTEWYSIIHQSDVELLSLHDTDLAIKNCGILCH